MSSKSRKKTPRTGSSAPATPAAAAPVPAKATGATGDAEAPANDPEGGLLGEDVIHVPRGVSRVQYIFLIGLMVFLLIVFLVPGAFLGSFGVGDGRDADYVRIDLSTGSRTYTASEFFGQRNELAPSFNIFPIHGILLGHEDPEGISDEEMARFLVVEALAAEAGILITDQDLATFLSDNGATVDGWRARTSDYGGPLKVEAGLRRVLAVRRFSDLLTQISRVPNVEEIERRWGEEHVEVAYDFVELEAASLVDQAKAENPDDAALEAWLGERPEFEQASLKDPERYRVTLATWRDAATTPPTALLERFPQDPPDPEARAQEYYNQVFFYRFTRPAEPEEDDGGEEETGGDESAGDEEAGADEEVADEEAGEEEPTPPQPQFLTFDEVKDVCLAEAPVFFALGAWRGDLQSRLSAGEEVDLAAEAAELGLEVQTFDEPQTAEELREVEGAGGAAMAAAVRRSTSGALAPNVVVSQEVLSVVRLDELVESAMPPFEEIREEVLDMWAEDRSAELALEQLVQLRDGFEAFEPAEDEDDAPSPAAGDDDEETVHRRADEEAFRAAAEAAGFTVGRRPWLDKSGPLTDDPDSELPAHRYLFGKRAFADMEDGELAEAELDRQREHAYLVRKVGQRDMDISRMSPQVYNSYKAASAQAAAMGLRQYLTGPDLTETYGIQWLVERDTEDDDWDEELDAEKESGEGPGEG